MAMSRPEMLEKMGINDDDFTEYLSKFDTFFKGLNPRQQAFHLENHERNLADIAQSLGPNATADDVNQLFKGAVHGNVTAAISCCGGHNG